MAQRTSPPAQRTRTRSDAERAQARAEWVRRVADTFPALTPELRDELAALFRPAVIAAREQALAVAVERRETERAARKARLEARNRPQQDRATMWQ